MLVPVQGRRERWDERYAARPQVWSSEPSREVARILGGWPPGRALDLGAGEGRHAIWLAEQGWQVTAVDFSSVGIGRGRARAAAQSLNIDWEVADATGWQPAPTRTFDLVLAAYLHLAQDVLHRAAGWLAPGGALVVVAHALRNLTDGVGGPSDPAILYTPAALRDAAAGLDIERCEEVLRETPEGEAIDVVLVARSPGDAAPAGAAPAD